MDFVRTETTKSPRKSAALQAPSVATRSLVPTVRFGWRRRKGWAASGSSKSICTQALQGAIKTLQVTHFTKAQLLPTHTMDIGGIEGILVFNEKQNTFAPETITFYRLLMQYAQVVNIWNYAVSGQLPFVLDKHKQGTGAPALD